MANLTGRQIWLSILVMLLFAPVVLASGSSAFRPLWYPDRLAGVPLSVWVVVVLILVFVGLVTLFAWAAFGAPVSQDKDRE